jgi:predicted DNA-binding protein
MAMVTLRLDDETNARLTAAARHSGRSKSQIIKSLILDNLEEIEALEPLAEMLARYRKEKAEGTLEMMSLDEFRESIKDLLD